MTDSLEGYHFSETARAVYEFTWSEFCDWYVEMSKGRLRDEAGRATAQRVLAVTHLFVPKQRGLADSTEMLAEDELVEVTPKSIRLRKAMLDPHERRKADKAKRAKDQPGRDLVAQVVENGLRGFLAPVAGVKAGRH